MNQISECELRLSLSHNQNIPHAVETRMLAGISSTADIYIGKQRIILYDNALHTLFPLTFQHQIRTIYIQFE